MAILAMDTATEALGVAIGQDGSLIASTTFCVPRGHSRILQPAIAYVFQQSGLDMSSLTAISVGIGPGSYTGVRLSVSTAKAMAVTLHVPLYPISTLAGMAEASTPGFQNRTVLIMPLIFARRGRAFGAFYRKQGACLTCVKTSAVMSVADWCMAVAEAQETENADLVVVHDFLPKHGVLDILCTLDKAHIVPLRTVASQLGYALVTLAYLGHFAFVSGEQLHDVVPEYALEVEAEVQLRERGQIASE